MYYWIIPISIFIIIFLLSIRSNEHYLNILLRQASRWAVAAQQDNNPLIAVLHANYAAGYLWAIKDIASSEEIMSITGINIKDLERKIIKIQDQATTQMSNLCPQYTGDGDKFLMAVAGDI